MTYTLKNDIVISFCLFRLLVWVTAYQNSHETKPDVLWDNLTNALTEIHELFMSSLHTSKQ